MMGSHGLLAKCVMFEEAVRVPLLIRLPGQKQGRRITGPVSHIDIVPTLLDLLHQSVSSHLQGASLCEFLEGDRTVSERNVFIEWNGPDSGIVGKAEGSLRIPSVLKDVVSPEALKASILDPVRTIITPDGWKLNYSCRGEHELYNLSLDPGETTNVFYTNENRSIVDKLTKEIAQWRKRANDCV